MPSRIAHIILATGRALAWALGVEGRGLITRRGIKAEKPYRVAAENVAFLFLIASRVENRRSDCSLPVDIRRSFRRATAVRFGLVLFPVPAHRTGQADFPHPALGKDTRCSV